MSSSQGVVRKSQPYSWGERVLRTAVLQMGVMGGSLERGVTYVFNALSERTFSPQGFDAKRAQESLERFQRLGAQVQTVVPQDGQAKLVTLLFRAQVLNEKLKEVGAQWKKITPQGEQHALMAIIPPEESSPEWEGLHADMLHLKWEERAVLLEDEKEETTVLVTAERADVLPEDAKGSKLFLHANSASVCFAMLTGRVGFYLGLQADCAFFDFRGTWKSEGEASEGGYYNDIAKVYSEVSGDYGAENIWVTSACGGCGPAAYLKTQVQGDGVNFIFENGALNLQRGFVDLHEGRLTRCLARRYWGALSSRDLPVDDRPVETGFNAETLWSIYKTDQGEDKGTVILVNVKNDQRLSKQVADENEELVREISQAVHRIDFMSASTKDPHFDRYFRYPDPRRQVVDIIYNPKVPPNSDSEGEDRIPG